VNDPDIEIAANVRSRRMRFGQVPETSVRFHGDCESSSTTERVNLPDEVEPGVVYRDSEVRWRVAARLTDD
jgi:hypothetical protein